MNQIFDMQKLVGKTIQKVVQIGSSVAILTADDDCAVFNAQEGYEEGVFDVQVSDEPLDAYEINEIKNW